MPESKVPETAEDRAERHLRERQERDFQSFSIFTEKVNTHYIQDPTSMTICYPENINRYQAVMEFWRQRFLELGILDRPDVQLLIDTTQLKVTSMLMGNFAPHTTREPKESIIPTCELPQAE